MEAANASSEPRLEAGAERTLEGVGSSAWFGAGARREMALTSSPYDPDVQPPTGPPSGGAMGGLSTTAAQQHLHFNGEWPIGFRR
jgi:hypothetical protein